MEPNTRREGEIPRIPAGEVIEHPFFTRDMEDLAHANLLVVGPFVPAHLRSANIAYLRVSRNRGLADVDVIIEFSKSPLQPPKVTRQSKKYFARITRSPLTFMDDSIFTMSSPYHSIPAILPGNPCTIKSYPYVRRRGNFVKPSENNFTTNLPSFAWCSHPTTLGTLCAVSGVGAIVPSHVVTTPGRYIVGLVRFH